MGKNPAFQFYANDFYTGTLDFTAEEVGGYIRLLCMEWDKGGLPNNMQILKRYSGCQGKTLRNILTKFSLEKDGFFYNNILEEVREKKKEFSNKQKANAESRWGKRDANALPKDIPNEYQLLSQTDALHSSSSNINLSKDKINKPKPPKVGKSETLFSNEKHNLQIWLEKENLTNVLKMKQQLTFEECEKLVTEYGKSTSDKKQMQQVFTAMHNWKPLLQKNVSVNLTFRDWIEREKNKPNGQNDSQGKDFVSGKIKQA
jgi:uncharacterized protein YdaU (DUF1376 family)